MALWVEDRRLHRESMTFKVSRIDLGNYLPGPHFNEMDIIDTS